MISENHWVTSIPVIYFETMHFKRKSYGNNTFFCPTVTLNHIFKYNGALLVDTKSPTDVQVKWTCTMLNNEQQSWILHDLLVTLYNNIPFINILDSFISQHELAIILKHSVINVHFIY